MRDWQAGGNLIVGASLSIACAVVAAQAYPSKPIRFVVDVREKLEALGGEIVGSTPSEFSAYLKSEIAKWDKVAKSANIRLD